MSEKIIIEHPKPKIIVEHLGRLITLQEKPKRLLVIVPRKG